ncbi:hypothetical protein [Paenibacillus sp.]|uniref:hypothetical protein n=1 Tax=Paenibacillus sp. TaxID=58172 RepID=UPI003463C93F
MQIQLNGKPLCTIAETRLIDVYQLLGKHSFTFHLDKERGILDIMNPLQGCRIVLESKMAEIVDRLWYPIQSTLSQAGLRVTIVDSEDTRKQMLNESNNQRQGIWISAVQDDAMEVSVHYFFHHRKQSKQLSQLLIMNLLKYSELPIRGASLNWKDRSNYQLSLAGQSWTTVALTYGGFLRLSTEQLMQLANGIMRAAASFFSYLPILDVIEKLRAMEKRDGFEVKSAMTEQPAGIAEPHQEDIVSLQVEHTQEAQVQPSPQTEAIAYSHEQVEKPGRIVLEEKFAQEEELYSSRYDEQCVEATEEVETVIEPEQEEEWEHTDNEWQFNAAEIDGMAEIVADESYTEDRPVHHSMTENELAGNKDYEQAGKHVEVEKVEKYTEDKKNSLTSDIAIHKQLDDEREDNRAAMAASADSQLEGEQEADEMSNHLNSKQAHNALQNEATDHSDNDEHAQQHEENKRQTPNFSTFTWLHANTVKRNGDASNKGVGEYASLLSYMNQKSLTSQPRKAKQPDLLTMQRERVKREQSPSDQS